MVKYISSSVMPMTTAMASANGNGRRAAAASRGLRGTAGWLSPSAAVVRSIAASAATANSSAMEARMWPAKRLIRPEMPTAASMHAAGASVSISLTMTPAVQHAVDHNRQHPPQFVATRGYLFAGVTHLQAVHTLRKLRSAGVVPAKYQEMVP